MSAVIGSLISAALILLLAPLFDGMIRKLKAVIQSRKGPPLLQPYIDLLKLLGKEDIQSGGGAFFRAAPIAAVAALLVAAMLTPLYGAPSLGSYGDIIAWVYVMSLAAVAVMLGAFSSGSPYSYAGAGREMMMLLTAEPVAVVALLTAAYKARTLLVGGIVDWQLVHGPSVSLACAGIAFFLALQANIGRLPFDIPEAESEIIEGPFMEYSGPRFALFKLALSVRQLIYSLFLVWVFVPWPGVISHPLALVIGIAKVTVLFVFAAVIEAVMPRLRIDQAMNYMSRVLFVALAALVFAVIGV